MSLWIKAAMHMTLSPQNAPFCNILGNDMVICSTVHELIGHKLQNLVENGAYSRLVVELTGHELQNMVENGADSWLVVKQPEVPAYHLGRLPLSSTMFVYT